MTEHITHEIGAVFDEHSAVLVLGTMPSPKSREQGFYYAHKQNRFWYVMAELFGEKLPMGKEERRAFALSHRIALWDVLSECEIEGASDSSIREPKPNDIPSLLEKAHIKAVFTTGKTAEKYYRRFFGNVDTPFFALPSTSPANAKMKLPDLVSVYKIILEYLD